jgi:hypothetical protein
VNHIAALPPRVPNMLSALAIVRPETVIRWHRAGFRLYWRWKSKSPGGRPKCHAIQPGKYQPIDAAEGRSLGYNFRRLLAWLRFLLLRILIALGLAAQLKLA